MIKIAGPLMVVCSLLMAWGGYAVAQDAKVAVPGACSADGDKLCAKDQGAARVECLRTHQSDVSAACKAALSTPAGGESAASEGQEGGRGRRGRGQFAAACGADADKLCASAGEGRARFQCLTEHESELSAGCKALVQRFRSRTRGN